MIGLIWGGQIANPAIFQDQVLAIRGLAIRFRMGPVGDVKSELICFARDQCGIVGAVVGPCSRNVAGRTSAVEMKAQQAIIGVVVGDAGRTVLIGIIIPPAENGGMINRAADIEWLPNKGSDSRSRFWPLIVSR